MRCGEGVRRGNGGGGGGGGGLRRDRGGRAERLADERGVRVFGGGLHGSGVRGLGHGSAETRGW